MSLRGAVALAVVLALLHVAAGSHHKRRAHKLKVVPRPKHLGNKLRKITHVHTSEGWTSIDQLPGLHPKPGAAPIVSRRALMAAGSPPPPHHPPPAVRKPPPPPAVRRSPPPAAHKPPPAAKKPPPVVPRPPPPAAKRPPPPAVKRPPPPSLAYRPPPPSAVKKAPPPPFKVSVPPPASRKPPPPMLARRPPPPVVKRPPPPLKAASPPPHRPPSTIKPPRSPPPKRPPPPLRSPPPRPPPPPAAILPATCSPGLFACCDNTGNLATVPGPSVNGLAPFSSTVQLISYLYDQYGDYIGVGGCSGTVSQRANTILTAGHCYKEGTTTSNNIRAYFNLYNGGYSDYQPIIRISTWDDWLNYGDYFADQALFQMGASKSPALVMPTQDIRHLYTQQKGYKEPYNSVGFPGFTHSMKNTPNTGGRCMGMWDAKTISPGANGTYALYLPILAGMSGGGVFTNDTRLFATNDFSVTSPGCSSGNCYNGYTPIDNDNWPLSELLSLLGPQSPA